MPDNNPVLEVGKSISGDLNRRIQSLLVVDGAVISEVNRKYSNYKNFISLDGKDSSIASQILKRNAIEELFSLTSAQLSCLVPKIQIFKAFNNGESIEFIFPEQMDENNIDLINYEGYTGQVGIKEVSYSFNGGFPSQTYFAEIDLKLIFRNLNDFTHVHYDPITGKEWSFFDLLTIESVDQATKAKTEPFRIRMVLGWQKPEFEEIPQRLRDNWDSLSIILVMGLSTREIKAKENGIIEIDMHYKGSIDDVFSDSRTNILEDPEITRQRLEVNEVSEFQKTQEKSVEDALTKTKEFAGKELNGSFNGVQIYNLYNAFDSLESTPSVMLRSTLNDIEGKSILDYYVNLSRILPQYNLSLDQFILPEHKEAFNDRLFQTALVNYSSQTAALNIVKSKILPSLEKNIAIIKSQKYSRMIRSILTKGKMNYIDYPKDLLGVVSETENLVGLLRISETSLGENDEYTKRIQERLANAAIKTTISEWDIHPMGAISNRALNEIDIITGRYSRLSSNSDQLKAKALAEFGDGYDDVFNPWSGMLTIDEAIENKKKELEGNMQEIKVFEDVPDDKIRAEFMFFGDILDAALQTLKVSDSDLFRTKILLGSIEIFSSNGRYVINIADIPISLPLFTVWFNDSIVKPQLEEFSFRSFLNSAFEKLIPEAVKGIGGESMPQAGQIDFTMFTLSADSTNNDHFDRFVHRGRLEIKDNDFQSMLDMSEVKRYKQNKKEFTYLLVNMSWKNPSEFRGNIEEDFQRGIYHLYQGSELGLVKRVDWKASEQPFVPELKLVKDQQENGQLTKLATYHNADVEMIGNCLFYPGMDIFINPILIGIGDPRREHSSSRQMKIGGYMTVQKVSGIISAAGFSTRFEAFNHGYTAKIRKTNNAKAPDGTNPVPGMEIPKLEIPKFEPPNFTDLAGDVAKSLIEEAF